MGISVTAQLGGTERQSLPSPSGRSAKAELPGRTFHEVSADALRKAASQKDMALTIGCSEGRVSSKLADGSMTLKQVGTLGASAAVELGRALIDTYGPQVDPKQQIQRELRQARAHLDRAFDLFSEVA